MFRPLIGVTVDNCENNIASGKYESNVDYCRVVAQAGGLPLILPQEVELAAQYVELCDGIMLTGGDDACMEEFGLPTHPTSRCIEPRRQKFEFAILEALSKQSQRPALGICLGMQLMALHAGGRLNQNLPDTLPNAAYEHQNNNRHTLAFAITASAILNTPEGQATLSTECLAKQTVVSSHHQAVEDAGRLRVIATANDGVVEAIDDPNRLFYVGVQWHPERSTGLLNSDLIQRFVETCSQMRNSFSKSPN